MSEDQLLPIRPIDRRRLLQAALSFGLGYVGVLPAGCSLLSLHKSGPEVYYPNPLLVTQPDSEFVWTQIIDTLDDYFQIKTEHRVRRTEQEWSEGYVETFPQVGATAGEFWRRDSSPGFERLQSSLQTIRRTAFVRVAPLPEGYSISVEVRKELEDVDRSLSSGEGSAAIRHDGTITRTDEQLFAPPVTIGWIRLENDEALQQRILREIAGRTHNVTPP